MRVSWGHSSWARVPYAVTPFAYFTTRGVLQCVRGRASGEAVETVHCRQDSANAEMWRKSLIEANEHNTLLTTKGTSHKGLSYKKACQGVRDGHYCSAEGAAARFATRTSSAGCRTCYLSTVPRRFSASRTPQRSSFQTTGQSNSPRSFLARPSSVTGLQTQGTGASTERPSTEKTLFLSLALPKSSRSGARLC